MSGTLFRYVLSLYAKFFVAIFFAVLAIFLIADLGDRVKVMVSGMWADVAELYWNKALVAAQQLAPAAMMLAGGAGVSTLRKRGELTAMRSLSFSPASLYVPVGATALVAAALLMVFDEYVVTKAGPKVDDITVNRFNTWGDYRFYHRPKQWFRKGEHVFYLRNQHPEGGFEDVTVLTLTPKFKLAARIDAQRMIHQEGTRWRLTGGVERRFDSPTSAPVAVFDERSLELGVSRDAFLIRQGRPEQMPFIDLREQIAARNSLGLPTRQFILALHNRFAYPLMGVAATLLAVGLALRPGRKGHLTVALVEGLAVAVALWGMMVVGKGLVVAGHLPPQLAAWGPVLVLVAVATTLWLRREGRLGWSGI